MVVDFSTHQVDKARYMCTFTNHISISIHPQAHLVPVGGGKPRSLRVGIEPLAEPLVLGPLVSFKACEGDVNESYKNVMVEFLEGVFGRVLLLF